MRAGKIAYGASGTKITGTVPVQTGGNVVPVASDIVNAAGNYDTEITVKGVVVPVANVLAGTTIAGQAGAMQNSAGDTATLASSVSGTTLKLRASQGYRDGVDDNVTITDAAFIAENIRNGVNLFGIVGTLKEQKVMSLSYGGGPVSASSRPFKPHIVLIKSDITVVDNDTSSQYIFYVSIASGGYTKSPINLYGTATLVFSISTTATGFTIMKSITKIPAKVSIYWSGLTSVDMIGIS